MHCKQTRPAPRGRHFPRAFRFAAAGDSPPEAASIAAIHTDRIQPSEPKCFQAQRASVTESTSAEERNPLSRILYTLNSANQHIYLTRKSDSSPQALIHLPEAENGQIAFYAIDVASNQCGKKNISKRIDGIKVYVSEDGQNWDKIDIQLDDAQILNENPCQFATSTQRSTSCFAETNKTIRCISAKLQLGID